MASIIIGIAGGTGSGKTTVVQEVVRGIGPDRVSVIHQDSYYRDQREIPLEERRQLNYDHPDAIETELLIRHIRRLAAGSPVEVPVYDFAAHTRSDRTRTVRPRPALIIDGILLLAEPALRALLDIKVFVDTDADVRLLRRLRRDIMERGRDVGSVLDQYERTVRPMHLEFVEPSKRYADIIVPTGGENRVAIEMLAARVSSVMHGR